MRVLVLGSEQWRADLAARLEALPGLTVDECDPSLGDCVMYVRLDGSTYDAFVFAGLHDPVTRGALAVVAERAVLLPLVDAEQPHLDPLYDGYLLRLPRALGFRSEQEATAVIATIPQTADTPSELVGERLDDLPGLAALLAHSTTGGWRWSGFGV